MNQQNQQLQTLYQDTCERYESFIQSWNPHSILTAFEQAFQRAQKSIIQQIKIKNQALLIELQETKILMDQQFKKAAKEKDFISINQFFQIAQYTQSKIKKSSLPTQCQLISNAIIEMADKLITQQFNEDISIDQNKEEQKKSVRNIGLSQYQKTYYSSFRQHQRGHQNWRKGINAIFDQRQNDCFNFQQKSAEDGNIGGLHVQGYCFEEGVGCVTNFEKAFQCYARAAEQGNPTSLNNIGNFYQTGMPNFNKDIKKAIFYYELSAERGFGRACWNLGRLYLEGDEVQRDIVKAKWYFKRAIYLSLYDDILQKLDEIRQIQILQGNFQAINIEII